MKQDSLMKSLEDPSDSCSKQNEMAVPFLMQLNQVFCIFMWQGPCPSAAVPSQKSLQMLLPFPSSSREFWPPEIADLGQVTEKSSSISQWSFVHAVWRD